LFRKRKKKEESQTQKETMAEGKYRKERKRKSSRRHVSFTQTEESNPAQHSQTERPDYKKQATGAHKTPHTFRLA